MQVWQVKQTVLFEADGKVEDALPLFPALLARITDLSSKRSCENFVRCQQNSTTNAFEAFAVAPPLSTCVES